MPELAQSAEEITRVVAAGMRPYQSELTIIEGERTIEVPLDKGERIAAALPPPTVRRGVVELGAKAVITASSLGTVPAEWRATNNEKSFLGNGFVIGASLSYAFTTRLIVQPEILFTRRSYGIEDCGGLQGCGDDGFTIQTDSIDVPVLGRLDLATGRFRLGVVAGPFVAIAVGDRIAGRRSDSPTPGELVGIANPLIGLTGGVELRYRGVTLSWRYIGGIAKLADNLDSTLDGFTILLGYAPLAR